MIETVEELQRMLRESTDRYAALEDSLEKEKEENSNEVKRRNDTIRALNKELEDSKSLIQTLEHRGMCKFMQWYSTLSSCLCTMF